MTIDPMNPGMFYDLLVTGTAVHTGQRAANEETASDQPGDDDEESMSDDPGVSNNNDDDDEEDEEGYELIHPGKLLTD
jgi:hypothetical protein